MGASRGSEPRTHPWKLVQDLRGQGSKSNQLLLSVPWHRGTLIFSDFALWLHGASTSRIASFGSFVQLALQPSYKSYKP